MRISKISARLLSVVLAVMMLFSLVTVGFTSASAAKVEVAETGATIPAGTYLYLKPNSNWTQSSAWFAMYLWSPDDATWVKMEKVADSSTTVYRGLVPAGSRGNVIFCRMNPSKTALNWDSKWDQSVDLTYDGKNNCWAPASGQWNNATGSWSTYADPTLITVPAAPAAPTVTVSGALGGDGSEAAPYLVAPEADTTLIITGALGSANGLSYAVDSTTKTDLAVGGNSTVATVTAPALDESKAVAVNLWAYNKAGSVVKYSDTYATTTVYIKGYEQADTPDTPVVDNTFSLGYQKVDGLYAYAKTLAEGETLGANAWQRWHENSDGRNFYLPASASDTEVIVLNTYSSQVLLNGVIIPAGEYAVVPYESGTSYVCSGATDQKVTIYKTDAEGTIFVNSQDGMITVNDDEAETETEVDATYDLYAFLTGGSKNREAQGIAGAVASEENGVQEDTTIKKMKGRGNSTWGLAKKPFNITYKSDITLDNMTGKKWSLLANAQDSSLLRNRLVYDLANEVGMKYACDSRFVDMFVNGYYQGSYQLTQKIEMGTNTVMPDLDEVETDSAKDGYLASDFDFILELDTAANAANAGDLTFTTDLGQVMTHKVPDEPSAEQVAFMDAKYQALENALYNDDLATLATLVDINDFARAYLVNEVAKNLDAGVTSCYFVYNSTDDIFYMSPVWDYDNALGNSHSIAERHDADGKMLDVSRPDGWYAKELMHFDSGFKGGRSVFSEACYMTSKTADGKTFMDIVKEVWDSSFAGVADVLTGDAQSSKGRLHTLDGYLASLAQSGEWNYGKGWQLSNNTNNTWIANHNALVMYSYDAEANTLSTSNKTYDQTKFEDQAAYAADWMLSRINWMSAQFADAETVVPEGYITVYFTNNWMFETQNVYYWGGTTGTCAAWPGESMTFVETNSGGENIYCANIPADVDGFLFCGISDTDHTTLRQTVDITVPTEANTGYYCVGETDGKITVGTYTYEPTVEETTTTAAETTPAETTTSAATTDETVPATSTQAPVAKEYITIYFSNAWKWTDVRVHTFGSEYEADTEWPGKAMTLLFVNDYDQEVYTATVAADVTGIVFTGKDGETLKQSADIVPEDGYGYYMDWSEEEGDHTDKYLYEEPTVETTTSAATADESVPATTTQAPVAKEYITIYFSNAWAWTDVRVHTFGSAYEADTEWPGKAMTLLFVNDYDQEVYTATVAADVTGIVFTGKDGETLKQSADIVPEDGYGYYMDWSEEEGDHTDKYLYEEPTVETTTSAATADESTPAESTPAESTPDVSGPDMPTVVTVYAINSLNWSELSAHVWGATSAAETSWPGKAMTKTEETVNGFDVYTISFDADYANIIFNNNNNGSQTENLTLEDGKYYDIKGGAWYDSLEDVPAVDVLASDVYLAGSFNGWSTTANEFKLTEEGAATAVVTLDLEAATTYEFKIVREGAWTSCKDTLAITESVAGLTFSSSVSDNTTITTTDAGTYTFTWTLDKSQLAVQYPGQEVPEPTTPDEPEPDTTVKLAGSFTDWATGAIEMTLVEGSTTVYTATDIRLDAATADAPYEFKIIEFGTWLGNNGTIENTAEGWTFKNKDAEGNDLGNCKLTTIGGTYTFIFDSETDKVTVTAVLDEVTTPDEPDVPVEPTVKYYTVIYLNADGTFLGYEKVEEGKAVVGIADPTKAADAQYTYTFAGWDADLTAITADTVVTAQYDKTVNKYTVTFLDKDGKAIGEAQSVEYGAAAVAPTAPAVDGYTFTGWDVAFDAITADTTVKAQYKKVVAPVEPATTGSLKVEIAGGNGFTIVINGGSARPQGTSYTSSKTPIGATVTLTANTVDGVDFLGWYNPMNGELLTADYAYEFITSGNDFYKAMYKTDVAGVNTVIFKNDKAFNNMGQIIEMQYYAAGDDIVFPENPTQTGWDFKAWNMTEEQIQAELAAGNDVEVLATWTVQKVYITVDVIGGTASGDANAEGKYLANNMVTLTADAAPAGQKFAYWTVNGVVRSYETEFSFYPSASCKAEAVFVAADAAVEYEVLVNLDTIDTVSVEGKNVFYYSWYVPEEALGVTFVKAGVIAVNKDNYKEENMYAGVAVTGYYDRSNTTGATGTFTWTKSSVTSGQTWVARAYVQYKLANGEIVTVYSDIVEATKE